MAKVIIGPVATPKSFSDVKFTKSDHDAAVKQGDILVPQVGARDAIRNSKGLYEIKQDVDEVVAVKSFSLEDKSNDDLKLMALSAGIPLNGGKAGAKKRISRTALITAITSKLAEVDVDDDDDDDDDDE